MSQRLRRVGVALLVAGVVVATVPSLFSAVTSEPVTRVEDRPANDTLVAIQQTGHVSAYGPDADRRWRFGGAEDYFDVTYLNDSHVLAAFRESGYEACGPYDPPCSRTGARLLRVEGGEASVVREYSFPVRTWRSSEVHDAELLPDGRLLVADMEYERVFITDWEGEVDWSWNASRRYDGPADPTRSDWLHINDVDRIADGRYLVSVRNANQVLVLERGEGVVEVINEDGDESLLHKQHNPQWLGDGRVLVADSDNDRVVELRRGDGGEWEIAWAVDAAGGYKFDWPRDADRLPNGNTLVSDTRNQRVVEINESGAVQWSRRLPANLYEADRVPGERAYDGTAPTYDGGVRTSGDGGMPRIPLFTRLRSLASYKLPVPIWFTGLHLLALTGGGALAAAGAGLAFSRRVRELASTGHHA